MATRSVHLTITGLVQGVGYRAWLADTARVHGLAGWTRNRRDGSVEAVLSGSDETVNAVIDACHQGPQSAAVAAVQVTPTDAPPATSFDIHPTA
jgi:acylphosphatase